MGLDLMTLQETFNKVARSRDASMAEKFVVYEYAIRQLEAAVDALRRESNILLSNAVAGYKRGA